MSAAPTPASTMPTPKPRAARVRRSRFLATALTFCLAGTGVVALLDAKAATTVTVAATADAFVSQGAPNAKNGTAVYLRSVNSTSGAVKSYLAFDLTGVTGTITGASLQMYSRSTQAATYTVSATTAFTESTVTWATSPALGVIVNTFLNTKVATWNTVDVTAGTKVGQVMYLAISGGNNKNNNWDSREAPNKPRLILTIADPATTTTAPPTTTTTIAPPTTTTTIAPPATTTTIAPPATTFNPNRFQGVLGIGQSNSYSLEALDSTGTKVSYPAKGITNAMNDAVNTHAKLVRMEWMMPSNAGASTLSSTQLTAQDAHFQTAKANSLGVILLVDYTPSDLWNATFVGSPNAYPSSGHTFPRDPAMQDKYVARTMMMIEHLQAAYPGTLVALEDQNEPNGWEFGSARAIAPFRPIDYVSLLAKMQTAIKASNAKFPAVAPVLHLTGGPSTGTTSNTNGTSIGTPTSFFKSMAAATNTLNGATHYGWYNALKDAGAMPGTHFDHITAHFYDKTIDSNYSMNFDKIWGVWAGPQVWATEQSKSVNPYYGADSEYTPSPANQATWLSNNLTLWAGKGTKAGAWIAFCNYDRNTGLDETTITSATVASTWGDAFGFYGLRDGTGAQYPSFTVFANKNGRV